MIDISVADYGAIGDGDYHSLSERYSTLSDARNEYPFVNDLTQSIDYAAIQKALFAAASTANTRARVYLPDGYYVITDSLRLPNFVTLEGASRSGTVLHNQNHVLNAPQIVNDDPNSFIMAGLRNLNFLGGTYGVRVDIPTTSGEVANVLMEDCGFALQTVANVQFNRLLQASSFIRCGFGAAPYGFVVAGWTTNHVQFEDCTFSSHEWNHLWLNTCQVVNVTRCRFEAGGILNRTTILVDAPENLSFDGCYFEGTHTNLITLTNDVSNTTRFANCHFTGASDGQDGLAPYTFASAGRIGFVNCSWFQPSPGPLKIALNGDNQRALGSNAATVTATQHARLGRELGPRHNFSDSLAFDALQFSRTAANSEQAIGGRLRVVMKGYTSAGGFASLKVEEYLVAVVATPSNGMRVSAQSLGAAGGPSGFSFAVAESNSTELSVGLQLTCSGANAAGSSFVHVEFEWSESSSSDSDHILVAVH